MDPVVKAFDERQTQMRVDQFFSYNQRFAKIRSQRLQQAVRGISQQPNPEMELQVDEVATVDPPPQAARKAMAGVARWDSGKVAGKRKGGEAVSRSSPSSAAAGKAAIGLTSHGPGLLRTWAATTPEGKGEAGGRPRQRQSESAPMEIVNNARPSDGGRPADTLPAAERGSAAGDGGSGDSTIQQLAGGVPLPPPPPRTRRKSNKAGGAAAAVEEEEEAQPADTPRGPQHHGRPLRPSNAAAAAAAATQKTGAQSGQGEAEEAAPISNQAAAEGDPGNRVEAVSGRSVPAAASTAGPQADAVVLKLPPAPRRKRGRS